MPSIAVPNSVRSSETDLKNINIQTIMTKNYKRIGIVLQPGNTSNYYNAENAADIDDGNNSTKLPKCVEGKKVYSGLVSNEGETVCITDLHDALTADMLDTDNPDQLFVYGNIVGRYNSELGTDLIIKAAKGGSIQACVLLGREIFVAGGGERMMEEGKKYAKKAAEDGHECGKCWLGRYYAEGKGCTKNKVLAKKWISEAASVCPEAEKYLDQYGLR